MFVIDDRGVAAVIQLKQPAANNILLNEGTPGAYTKEAKCVFYLDAKFGM